MTAPMPLINTGYEPLKIDSIICVGPFVATFDTVIDMRFADGTYPGANGNVVSISGAYKRS